MPQTQTSFSQGVAYIAQVDATIPGSPDAGSRALAILQESSVTFDWTSKSLYGQQQYPLVVARGEAKVTGKSTFAGLDSTVLGQAFFGLPISTGQFGVAQDEAGAVPSLAPFIITVGNAASFSFDLGVRYASGANAGSLLTRVATPTVASQYSVNFTSGVYTFSSADANAALLISYHYTNPSTGKLLTVTNALQGFTPYFRAVLFNSISPNPPPSSASSAPWALCFNACTASKVSMPRKVNEFTLIEVDWEAFADGSGIVGFMSTLT